MNYQNYEEYMRSVLGYSPYVDRNYTYTDEQEDMYNYTNEVVINSVPSQDLTAFYPEIYKIIYPMVCKICNVNIERKFTKDLLEQMCDEVYKNVEPEQENANKAIKQPILKNGDVRNPNVKEPEPQTRETRQTNFLLRDLIKVLILREWGRPARPQQRPYFQDDRPSVRPGMPGNMQRPPMGPSPQRPKYF